MALTSSQAHPFDLPRLLILDAHDSYTRNILDLIYDIFPPGSIQRTQLESRVLVLRADKLDWEILSNEIIPHFAGLILGPGPGRPAKGDGPMNQTAEHPGVTFTRIFSSQPLQSLSGYHIPTFGLCLGHQALGFAFGAQIKPATQVLHGQTCELELELDGIGRGKGILNLVSDGVRMVRYNSLTVEPATLPQELDVTAWANEGSSKSVMGLMHNSLPFHGVQFHPESICSTDGAQIVKSFLNLISSSSYVNEFLGRSKSFSPLPQSILQHSELRTLSPSSLRLNHGNTVGNFSFQLRTKVFEKFPWDTKDIFERLIRTKSKLGEVWLDSSDYSLGLKSNKSHYSHMASVNVLFSYFLARKTLIVTHTNLGKEEIVLDGTTFWEWLRLAQASLEALTQIMPFVSSGNSCDVQKVGDLKTGFPRASVGFLGYIGYELHAESLLKNSLHSRSEVAVADAELGFCNTALTYDHKTGVWAASALVCIDESSSEALTEHLGLQVGMREAEYEAWEASLEEIFSATPTLKDVRQNDSNHKSKNNFPKDLNPLIFTPIVSRSEYLESITAAQLQILAGESYELCLTTQFRGKLKKLSDNYMRYARLREKNPAPYGAYIYFSAFDIHILSSSPERFMSIDDQGRVEMKPIKGTTRRNLNDLAADAKLAESLQKDEKERAENLMITDLIRHDLHSFCTLGSVKVTRLFSVETVASVHSLVSTVTGQLRPGLNAVDGLKATFPPGSMTGAPKLRSVEILDMLENSKPRGVYSGSIGFISVDGRSDMSVVIRTAVVRGSEIFVGGGGAITRLSDKEKEWDEVKLKVAAVQNNLNI